jgi:hypothetical protein
LNKSAWPLSEPISVESVTVALRFASRKFSALGYHVRGNLVKGGPLKNKSSALPNAIIHPRVPIFILFLSLASCFSPRCWSQVTTIASAGWAELVGTYNEPTTGKTLRILEKGGRLICQSADGLAFAEFRLVQALPGDTFEIVETNTRQQVTFLRDKSGKISGLKFGGSTFRQDSSSGSEAAPSSELDRATQLSRSFSRTSAIPIAARLARQDRGFCRPERKGGIRRTGAFTAPVPA